jgi:SsrA-binding protein
MKLVGAFIHFRGNKAFLVGAGIPPYPSAGPLKDYDPARTREILLHKKQIDYLRGKSEERGLTIVPLGVYTKGRYLKLEIGVALGKTAYDKRETIKKRDLDRSMRRGEE